MHLKSPLQCVCASPSVISLGFHMEGWEGREDTGIKEVRGGWGVEEGREKDEAGGQVSSANLTAKQTEALGGYGINR